MIRTVSWSPAPHGPYFAIGTTGRALRLAGVDQGQRIRILNSVEEMHAGSVYDIAWNASGDVIATGSNDKTVKIVLPAARDPPHSAQCTVDYEDDTVSLGRSLSLHGHSGTVRCVEFVDAFRPGYVASAGAGDCAVRVRPPRSLNRV